MVGGGRIELLATMCYIFMGVHVYFIWFYAGFFLKMNYVYQLSTLIGPNPIQHYSTNAAAMTP